MLISELINLLKDKKDKLGDQEVMVWDSEDGDKWFPAPIVQIRQNRRGQVVLEAEGD